MTAAARSAAVKQHAAALGFDAAGITGLGPSAHAADFDRWLAAGYAGTMTYLHRQGAKRREPSRIWPAARSAVVTLTNYRHPAPAQPAGPSTPRVAQYAWSTDYHVVLGARLERLAAAVCDIAPGSETRCYVDAGPVPERELAQRAGLGWIGKNMMLIHPELGSFTFIGVILTDADLAADLPFAADRCGTCRACLDACPTDAFVAPREMDARRCISYLTIEHRGPFDDLQRAMVGEWAFGCDVCQDVCPWNVRFAPATDDAELSPRGELAAPDLTALRTVEPDDFARRYADTAFARVGAAGLRRNAEAVAANRGAP